MTDADVLDELKNVEVSTMTPLDALNTLYRLQNKLKTDGRQQCPRRLPGNCGPRQDSGEERRHRWRKSNCWTAAP